ncbi:4-hydroxy-tetrahydrodipicolinate synthase [Amycolatopsis acidiphila]|uniref:4-hydroxy-tetrahydrodipicolinate synthase n=1 Tax=Amycolatopsis acidiphila TaxID=715473 RepID=A0A558APB9_9PSEU|nr:4-hydroxy-tetrahydrodipicolinate synthase [Amycolatopsis acidiphila]TVT26092.1 4-hydroxy-tetrahydrodipicolinate synthase [Amycolatopsis acidiphila]UIJ63182.1 4-hydroxy-tetrahydrodipicolinate synthase [Amycolatopsis acidiphila]GHG74219.1 4-hydroxy-tetrahydrodipicolinate synthase [Amycolatopsis acidiphila]
MKYRTDPARIRGAIAPLFTPFTGEGVVDHDSLRAMVRWQLANGSHGISIGGSTGEPSSQTLAERAEAIRTVAEEVGDRVPFAPGTGSAKLDETLELTGIAAEAGADVVLVITPYYARPTQEALYVWYSTVAREFPDLPIVAYNVPVRTAVEIAPQTFARLYRDHENIVGIKETTKDFEHFSRVMHLCGRDLLMWSGIELLCLPLIALGGAGFISALSNIAPAAVAQTYEAAVAGDWDRARELHYGVHPLVDLLFTETNPAPSKWLMAERGLIRSGHVRPPLVPLTQQGREKVRALAAEAEQYLTPVPARSLS